MIKHAKLAAAIGVAMLSTSAFAAPPVNFGGWGQWSLDSASGTINSTCNVAAYDCSSAPVESDGFQQQMVKHLASGRVFIRTIIAEKQDGVTDAVFGANDASLAFASEDFIELDSSGASNSAIASKQVIRDVDSGVSFTSTPNSDFESTSELAMGAFQQGGEAQVSLQQTLADNLVVTPNPGETLEEARERLSAFYMHFGYQDPNAAVDYNPNATLADAGGDAALLAEMLDINNRETHTIKQKVQLQPQVGPGVDPSINQTFDFFGAKHKAAPITLSIAQGLDMDNDLTNSEQDFIYKYTDGSVDLGNPAQGVQASDAVLISGATDKGANPNTVAAVAADSELSTVRIAQNAASIGTFSYETLADASTGTTMLQRFSLSDSLDISADGFIRYTTTGDPGVDPINDPNLDPFNQGLSLESIKRGRKAPFCLEKLGFEVCLWRCLI